MVIAPGALLVVCLIGGDRHLARAAPAQPRPAAHSPSSAQPVTAAMASPSYDLVTLKEPAGWNLGALPVAIAATGQVAGTAGGAEGWTQSLGLVEWNGLVPTIVHNGWANGITPAGTPFGASISPPHAFQGLIGAITTLPVIPTGVNPQGRFVGYQAPYGEGSASTFLLGSGGATTSVIQLAAAKKWNYPTAINSSNVVAGYARDTSKSQSWPVVWSADGKTATILPSRGSRGALSAGEAYAINDAGFIVGIAGPPGDERAARWHNGAISLLGTLPGGSRSAALAIDKAGATVGWATDASGIDHAVLFTVGGVVDLNTRIDRPRVRSAGGALAPAATPPFFLAQATGINDAGEICGFGSGGPFVLKPRPTPPSNAFTDGEVKAAATKMTRARSLPPSPRFIGVKKP
jgi:hypothetical protein